MTGVQTCALPISGVPLSRVYHSLPYNDLVKLVKNIASILLPLFAHRFSDIGSLYFGPDPRAQTGSGTPTPKATQQHYSGFPFSPTLGSMTKTPSSRSVCTVMHDYHVGPIISWPFFGSNRGELAHPTELDRGPWNSFEAYVESSVDREIKGVVRENEGRSAPHRLHLDPAEIRASRHHRLNAVPGDESDDSDEYSDIEESEEEWEGPGDTMYSDYRRMQRSTFLVAHMSQREEVARKEMDRWKEVMGKLVKAVVRKKDKPGHEQFALDCHDLSVENVFVDPKDHSKITCIIDWESTTTRPLWASAHLPACIQSSPFVSKLFRAAVAELPSDPTFCHNLAKKHGRSIDPTELCREWLFYEAAGARLRMAHRCAEWDGWEEGLVDSILGPVEFESEWFKAGATSYDHEELKAMIAREGEDLAVNGNGLIDTRASKSSGKSSTSSTSAPAGLLPLLETAPATMLSPTATDSLVANNKKLSGLSKPVVPLPFVVEEAKEKMLDKTGDYCGGRGGELGLRLEAWLSESANPNGKAHSSLGMKRWHGDDMSASASAMLSPSLEA